MKTDSDLIQNTKSTHYLRNGMKLKKNLDRKNDKRFMSIEKLLSRMEKRNDSRPDGS